MPGPPSPVALPSPELVALLRTCKDEPDDDVPRLILADWLEESGDLPRAEFIRLQCEVNQANPAQARRGWLVQREGELFVEAGTDWTAPLVDWAREWEWHRGFCRWATPKNEVVRYALMTAAPRFPSQEQLAWVEGLCLNIYDDSQMLEGLTTLPQLLELRRLRIRFGFWSAVDCSRLAGILANSPFLANLRELFLDSSTLDASAATALSNSPHLHNLQTLRLNRSPAGQAKDTLTARFGDRLTFEEDEPPHYFDSSLD